jgi:hypothetical protein
MNKSGLIHRRQRTAGLALALGLLLLSDGPSQADQFPDRSAMRGALNDWDTRRISPEFRGLWGSPREACRGAGVTMRIEESVIGDLPVRRIRGFSDDSTAIEVTVGTEAGSAVTNFIELSALGFSLRVRQGNTGEQRVFHRCSAQLFAFDEPVLPKLEAIGAQSWEVDPDGGRGVMALLKVQRETNVQQRSSAFLHNAAPRLRLGCGRVIDGETHRRFALDFTQPTGPLINPASVLAGYAAGVSAALSEPGQLILLDAQKREIARHIVYPTAEGLQTGPLRQEHFSRLINGPAHIRIETPRLDFTADTRGLRDAMGDYGALACVRQ